MTDAKIAWVLVAVCSLSIISLIMMFVFAYRLIIIKISRLQERTDFGFLNMRERVKKLEIKTDQYDANIQDFYKGFSKEVIAQVTPLFDNLSMQIQSLKNEIEILKQKKSEF